MKNDSNMFNDNNIETEGAPADKTAEIPKVVDSTEEEIRKEVRRACEEYAPNGHFIPCITYGGPGCLFPHVDSIIDDEIEKYNKEVYGI